jgi:tetratricopeptide (TPR) repeat protein
MAISVFLSTVSDEFRAYRDQLVHDLTRHNVAVKVQEDFKDLGGDTLDKLDVYIAHCDAVVHLVGDMCGTVADEMQQRALLAKHPDLPIKLPPLGQAFKNGVCLSYTQWEAWLALYHGKPLLIAKTVEAAPRGPRFAPSDASRASQAEHLERLKAFRRHPSCEFVNPDDLAKHIAVSAILDLLVVDYAKKAGRERDVAEGFIREMAKRVAGDAALDLDGMKQAVRNAIEIYEKEIAGQPVETNLDEIVGRALGRAKEQVDRGQSALARATLRRGTEEMRREKEDYLEGYVTGVTTLYHRERDIALAAYDGGAAAEAVTAMANALHANDRSSARGAIASEADTAFAHGDEKGSNVHLVAAISLRRSLAEGASRDERGLALVNLGTALWKLGEREARTAKLEEAVEAYREALQELTRERVPLDWAWAQGNLGAVLEALGARETGTARLEDAVTAYRAALGERTRERVPLDWAATQANLGNALLSLGRRESGTARLDEAVAAYRAALEELTRERVPLDWAATQTDLGIALVMIGERESGTARLKEAVAAYRAALEELTRERVPLQWAATQMNLGSALARLGERESGTARLEEAVAAYRAALEERTRERVPLDWAATQNNLGNALAILGARESGTARLMQAVRAYRAALEENAREQVPLDWAETQNNLGNALFMLGEREDGTAWLVQAVQAYRAALEERTRERIPLDWAQSQANLGNALKTLEKREGGTENLQEAIAAFDAALEELTFERVPLYWAASLGSQGGAMILIADRTNNRVLAETAIQQIQTAVETLRSGGQEQWAAISQVQLTEAQAIRDRLKGK